VRHAIHDAVLAAPLVRANNGSAPNGVDALNGPNTMVALGRPSACWAFPELASAVEDSGVAVGPSGGAAGGGAAGAAGGSGVQ